MKVDNILETSLIIKSNLLWEYILLPHNWWETVEQVKKKKKKKKKKKLFTNEITLELTIA